MLAAHGLDACNLIVAPFAAAMTFGGLRLVRDAFDEACARHGNPPGRLMCSYFLHFADTPAEEEAARARQIRYYRECAVAAFPGDIATAPPSYRYFLDIVDRLNKVRPEDLSDNSVLLGPPARIIESLKKVEAAGVAEVILYVNVGLKPHSQVKDEMARFMDRRLAPRPLGIAIALGRDARQLLGPSPGPSTSCTATVPRLPSGWADGSLAVSQMVSGV